MAAMVDNSMKTLADRITRLKVRSSEPGQREATHNQETQNTWVPMHIILGGWPDRTPREQIVREAAESLRVQPMSFREKVLDPFAPTKSGTIAKLKTKKGAAEQLALAASKAMRSAERTSAPTWAALERSPEAGRRKILTKGMVLECKAGFPQLDIDHLLRRRRGGAVCRRHHEAGAQARMGGHGVSWQIFERGMSK